MKLWLIGITTEGHKEDLEELIEPIKDDFDGLVWTFHYPKDEGADYLESVKGDGDIIYSKWNNRTDFSRNQSLFQGPIKSGDWFVTMDTLERLSPNFTKQLRDLIGYFENNKIDGAYIYDKRFMFRFNETMEFKGNPHEAILGTQNTVELTNLKIWDKSFQKNVRKEKRQDPFYFVEHNFKYYLFPNTNHLFLGFEDNVPLVRERYNNRMKLFQAVYTQGFDPYDYDSMKECLEDHLDDTMKDCINFDKFLNDWYRLKIIGETEGIIDKHDFSKFKPIDFLK